MAKKRVRVVTANDSALSAPVGRQKRSVVIRDDNPRVSNRLTNNEIRARVNRRYATSTTFGSSGFRSRTALDVLDSANGNFYSPQLSTDFLEKPQTLRERRAFYRFFYNTNEIIGQAIDIHSTLPLSKLRLVPPKGKNKHQNEYVYKFFSDMCENMKLFKTLIEMTHEYMLFGNCVPADSLLRTDRGFKRADRIETGDMVLTHMGRYRPVIKCCERDSDEIINLNIWKSFIPLRITDEHPVEVLRGNSFEFTPAVDISTSDYVRLTWPKEIKDISRIPFVDGSHVKKSDEGYSVSTTFTRKRSANGLRTRHKLASWLVSLSEPVVRSREKVAAELDVKKSDLDAMVLQFNKEISTDFHKRIGPKGFGNGSQVMWFPVVSPIDVEPEYSITKIWEYKSPHEIAIDEDFTYLAGYWLGDGTLGRDSSRDNWGRGIYQFSFGTDFDSNYHRIKNILVDKLGTECVHTWKSGHLNYVKVEANPAFIEWWAENFGESLQGDKPKRIPEWFEKLPPSKLRHFLSGLIDSDGCSSKNERKKACLNISMSCRELMDKIREIAFKCGVVFNYHMIESHTTTLPCGRLVETPDMYVLTTREKRSCEILTENSCKKVPDDYDFCDPRYFKRVGADVAFKVRSIGKDAGEKVYNFEVEEDHTYQVNGFSTHNCFIFAEEHDYREGTAEESSHKREESKQRSQFLKEKYDVLDKDPLFKGWKKLIILPPDQVRVRKLPLTDDVAIEYVPDPETKRFITSEMPMYPDMYSEGQPMKWDVPAEIRDKVRQSGVIPLDTDPNTGSHVYHLARKKSQYEPLGVSIIERCINTIVLMDKLRQAQTSIASRHMTPMRVVWAEDLNGDDIDNLREQVDLALVDPDYSIIANYEIHWEEMGSNGRLLDIEAEYEGNVNRLLAGLGVTREVLTGEGSYSGSKIGLEIMNTQYLLFREILQEYIENNLFKPIAKKKGFVEYDDYGNEVLLYPRISFTRLAIRDNEQFFDAAFQLYQKGSVSIDLILDILNIDPESTKEKIEKDMFTVNDSQFNEVLRNLYTNVATALIDQTDVSQLIAKNMGLEFKEAPAKPEAGGRFSSIKKKASVVEMDREQKIAKVVKYLRGNPGALENIFSAKK